MCNTGMENIFVIWKPRLKRSKTAFLVGGKRKALVQIDPNYPNVRVPSELAELPSGNLFPLPVERILRLNADLF